MPGGSGEVILVTTNRMSRKNSFLWNSYDIMHGNRTIARICKDGSCSIYFENFLPYNLYLEEVKEDHVEIRIQNLDNFYYWCASRILTLDREYAKEILNSIGVSQAVTDRERAGIALSYHCLSLMDIYWVKHTDEKVGFEEINLYENHLETAFVDVSLRGKQMTIQNSHLIADDLGTMGCYPKAWIRKEDGFRLLKDGGIQLVENELLASRIARCFRVNQVLYEADAYDGQKVTESKIITSLRYSIVPVEYFEIYALNHDFDWLQYVLQLDCYSYYMMNIIDYLIGNTDRHWGNWGLLVDNQKCEPIRLYDLMDFNKAFQAYDTIDGANCQTVKEKLSQKESALRAVMQVGLNQIQEIDPAWFADTKRREMFFARLHLLQEAQENKNGKNNQEKGHIQDYSV